MKKSYPGSQVYDPKAIGLDVTRYSGDEAVCRCPFHGHDRKPSSSFNILTGWFFCFSCGATFSASVLAEKLGGTAYKVLRRTLPIQEDLKEWRVLLDAEAAYDDTYLESRGVDNECVSAWKIKRTDFGIIFPLKTPGLPSTCGVIVRRKEGFPKYVVYGEKPPVWPEINTDVIDRKSRVFFVEGIFGALRARAANVHAFATLGAMIKREATPYLNLNDNVYGMFDNDFAGYVAGGRLLVFNPSARIIIPGQEADELSIEEWKYFNDGEIMTTRRMGQLARLSKDSTKFYSYMPKDETRK